MNKAKLQEKPEVIFHKNDAGEIHPAVAVKGSALLEIPPAIYSVQHCIHRGFYLRPEEDFKLPEVVYGNVKHDVQRFLKSFELNEKNLGVLMLGVSGSGKTLTLKELMITGVQMGFPGILINEYYDGPEFLTFMSMIKQPVVVGFDELDKTYSRNHTDGGHETAQRVLIQLLDGALPSNKKLFAFTANVEALVSQYLKNRPSRVRYTIRFKQLEQSTVVDYVRKNLKNCTEDHVRAFLHAALADGRMNEKGGGPWNQTLPSAITSWGMNFDSMRELVTEMNQFNCTLDEALHLMMVNGTRSYACFDIDIYKDGVKIAHTTARSEFSGSYVADSKYELGFSFFIPNPDANDETREKVIVENVLLTQEHFQGFGSELDMLEFEKDGYRFIARYASWEQHITTSDALNEEYMEAQKAGHTTFGGPYGGGNLVTMPGERDNRSAFGARPSAGASGRRFGNR